MDSVKETEEYTRLVEERNRLNEKIVAIRKDGSAFGLSLDEIVYVRTRVLGFTACDDRSVTVGVETKGISRGLGFDMNPQDLYKCGNHDVAEVVAYRYTVDGKSYFFEDAEKALERFPKMNIMDDLKPCYSAPIGYITMADHTKLVEEQREFYERALKDKKAE